MLTHLLIGTNDIAKARTFYDAIFGVLGYPRINPDDAPAAFYNGGNMTFGVMSPRDGAPATHANGGTISFRTSSEAQVDTLYDMALANGGRDEGAPGPREGAPNQARGSYVRDPDGNKLAFFHF